MHQTISPNDIHTSLANPAMHLTIYNLFNYPQDQIHFNSGNKQIIVVSVFDGFSSIFLSQMSTANLNVWISAALVLSGRASYRFMTWQRITVLTLLHLPEIIKDLRLTCYMYLFNDHEYLVNRWKSTPILDDVFWPTHWTLLGLINNLTHFFVVSVFLSIWITCTSITFNKNLHIKYIKLHFITFFPIISRY